MKQKSTSFKQMCQPKPADATGECAEDRLAKHGFFLNEDLQGTDEGGQLAAILADLINFMKEKSTNHC